MNKKYIFIPIGVIVLLAGFFLLKGFSDKKIPDIQNKNNIVEEDKNQTETKAPQEEVKIPNNNTPVKGKLPAGSAPVASPSSIQSVSWVWQKTVMGDGSVVAPKKVGSFTLNLKPDGNFSGKTDCNGFFGNYKVGTDGVITFGPVASTMMYCDGSQERVYTNAISASGRYMLDADGNLVLLLQYDSGSIFFKKE